MAHPHEALPTLRESDAPAAAAWYARLGFAEDWRHQHADDCPPRGSVFLVTRDIAATEAALQATAQTMPWGDRELSVLDPDGNRVRISQPAV